MSRRPKKTVAGRPAKPSENNFKNSPKYRKNLVSNDPKKSFSKILKMTKMCCFARAVDAHSLLISKAISLCMLRAASQF